MARDGNHAELLVIGGGPGGYTAAFRAADLGLDVTLVERHDSLGGACLNVGCIPSKILLHIAETVIAARDMKERGVEFGAPDVKLEQIDEYKARVIARLTKGLSALAKRRKVRVMRGDAAFISAEAAECKGADGVRTITFERAIIAVGARPRPLPDVQCDDPRLVDSTGALMLARASKKTTQKMPKKMLVIGGGVIGLEMACVYGALDTQVTIVEAERRLMAECDPDLVKPLEERLAKSGATILKSTRITGVETEKNGLKVAFTHAGGDGEDVFELALASVGRVSNADRIGADKAGVTLDERGNIPTDGQQRTNIERIFAVGDVTGAPLLAHKAAHQGKVAAEAAAGRKSAFFDAMAIPNVAYTHPEIAWTGLNELEAERRSIAVQRGVFPWSASGRALGTGADEGLTKILRDPASKRIVGAGIVGRNAGELIAEIVLAMEMGAESGDIAASIHPHPTLSETLGLTAEVLEKTVTDL